MTSTLSSCCCDLTATTKTTSLSLHDALPISTRYVDAPWPHEPDRVGNVVRSETDRKSTRLNSSHANISYDVFCLRKKRHYQVDTEDHNPRANRWRRCDANL